MIEKVEGAGPPKEVVHAATHADGGAAARNRPVGYDTPDFASDEAAEAWISAGQPALGEPSGKNGHTVADVRRAAAQTEE